MLERFGILIFILRVALYATGREWLQKQISGMNYHISVDGSLQAMRYGKHDG